MPPHVYEKEEKAGHVRDWWDSGKATEATGDETADEWMTSLWARIDRQTALLETCLARLGEPGTSTLSQKSDRQARMLETISSRLSEGAFSAGAAAPAGPTSVWRPKLNGAGYELRSVPRVTPAAAGVAQRQETPNRSRSNSLHSSNLAALTGLGHGSQSPRSALSDVPEELPSPSVGGAIITRGQSQGFAQSALHQQMSPRSVPSSAHSPGQRVQKTVTRRESEWRTKISAMAAEAAAGTGLARNGSPLGDINEHSGELDNAQIVERERSGQGGDDIQQVRPRSTPRSWKRRLWQFLEDKHSSRGALVYGNMSMFLILLCVSLSMGDVLIDSDFFPTLVLLSIESLFVLELAMRFVVCPNRDVFWLDVYNWIDALAICASVVPRIAVLVFHIDPDTAYNVRVFSPGLFLLRFLRRFEHFQLLASAFAQAVEALPLLLYTCFLIAIFHASAIYLVEPREVIPTMRDAVWFAIVTMSTVGYGDISPVTDVGRALTMNLIVLASLYTAIPIGIVGNAFSKVWEDRERLLLMQQLRQRITRGGYTPSDLAEIFQSLDEDGSGTLSFEEFKEMLPIMNINMSDTVAFRVFETFDDDGEGTIDFEEFLVGVFPAQSFFVMATRKSRET